MTRPTDTQRHDVSGANPSPERKRRVLAKPNPSPERPLIRALSASDG